MVGIEDTGIFGEARFLLHLDMNIWDPAGAAGDPMHSTEHLKDTSPVPQDYHCRN